MNLKKLERYVQGNLLGPGPRLMKLRIYRAAVSQRLRNTAVNKGMQLRLNVPANNTTLCTTPVSELPIVIT